MFTLGRFAYPRVREPGFAFGFEDSSHPPGFSHGAKLVAWRQPFKTLVPGSTIFVRFLITDSRWYSNGLWQQPVRREIMKRSDLRVVTGASIRSLSLDSIPRTFWLRNGKREEGPLSGASLQELVSVRSTGLARASGTNGASADPAWP